jgi:hypothetical protein
VGCEARKLPAEEEVFFLDFYLYRTNQGSEIESVNTRAFIVTNAAKPS